jgi:hypothetical protein
MNNGFDNPQIDCTLSPKHWVSCGAHSAYHALLCLGVITDKEDVVDWESWNLKSRTEWLEWVREIDVSDITNWISTAPCGLVLRQLLKRIKRHGGIPADITVSARGRGLKHLKRRIDRQLDLGQPIIIGCEADTHWAVLAGRSGRSYYWLDSAAVTVAGCRDWSEVEEWIVTDDEGNECELENYEAIAVTAADGTGTTRSIVPWMENLWELLADDEELAGNWALYLGELYRAFDFEGSRGLKMPVGNFFEQNEHAIVQPLIWNGSDGDLSKAELYNLYRNYWTVGDMHNLVVPAAFESHALAHLALLLADRAAEPF